MNLKKATFNGTDILATNAQIEALEALTSTNGGGIAVVHGYVSESGRIAPEVADITFISRFSYEKLNKRKLAAIESVKLEDIKEDALKVPKLRELSATSLQEAFEARKASMVASAEKTLAGDRSDAYREAHDRCYLRISGGVRVHYKTVADSEGKMQPITLDGVPIVNSIMLEMLEISRRVTTPGEYKVVNSGVPVLIENLIKHHLPKSTSFKQLSLKEGSFESLTISGQQMLPEDFKGVF